MKKHYIQSTSIISAPLSKIWDIISTGDQVETWHPVVTKCTLNGNYRSCHTEQGALEEEILVNDTPNHTFKYLIKEQRVYPSHNQLILTMKFVEVEAGTVFLWDMEYLPEKDEIRAEMEEGLKVMSDIVSRNLESLCNS